MTKQCETDLKKYYEPYMGNFLVPVEEWKPEYMADVMNILKQDETYYFKLWNDGESDYWCLSNLEL